MLNELFKNQVLMTFVIACFWLVLGIFFTKIINNKYNYRKKERQLKRISRLYPH